MRKLIWLAILAFACAASAQTKVTYTTVAVNAKKAVDELAAKSGMNLRCSAAMSQEILILRLQDAPMDEVMKQLAAVTMGAWQKEGDISYLVPNTGARLLEANKNQQHFAERIAKTLKTAQEQLAKAPAAPQPGMPAAMFGISPIGGGSLNKLALAIGPAQLASVPENGRVVFSTSPNRLQRGLPAAAMPIINEFVLEYNRAAASAKHDEPAKNEQPPEMAAFMQLLGSRARKPEQITGPPAKALVVAARRGMMGGGYSMTLKLYDAQGRILATANTNISTEMPFSPMDLLQPKNPPANSGKEIALSPLSKELYGIGESLSVLGGSSRLKMSKELTEALKDPVEHDPLSFVHSEALIAIATERNEQLVADLPDGVMSFLDNLRAKGKLTAQSYLSEISGQGAPAPPAKPAKPGQATGDEPAAEAVSSGDSPDRAKVQEANGWLVVSPADSDKARTQRTDRGSLRTLIRVAVTQGYVGLDDLADYSLKNGSPLDAAPASGMYIMTFAPNALQEGMMGLTNWDLLKFYGLLGGSQRQSLREGGRLAFGQLSPAQQNQTAKMVFGADAALTIDSGGRKQPSDPLTEIITTQLDRALGSAENDYRSEPTEVMPNGLPADGFISVKFTSEPIAQAQTMSTDLGRMSSLSSLELGIFKMFKEDPKMSQLAGAMPTFDDLKVGNRAVYAFSFNVAPGVSEKGTLNDDRIPKEAPVYKLNALPQDFQKRIDDMAANFKKNPIWSMIGAMGMLGQKAPPP